MHIFKEEISVYLSLIVLQLLAWLAQLIAPLDIHQCPIYVPSLTTQSLNKYNIKVWLKILYCPEGKLSVQLTSINITEQIQHQVVIRDFPLPWGNQSVQSVHLGSRPPGAPAGGPRLPAAISSTRLRSLPRPLPGQSSTAQYLWWWGTPRMSGPCPRVPGPVLTSVAGNKSPGIINIIKRH